MPRTPLTTRLAWRLGNRRRTTHMHVPAISGVRLAGRTTTPLRPAADTHDTGTRPRTPRRRAATATARRPSTLGENPPNQAGGEREERGGGGAGASDGAR